MSSESAAKIADEDTIVAISTPPGRGGIGIVRLSGPRAREIAHPLLRLKQPLAPGQARFAAVVDEDARLDDAVVTFFERPRSYTGEDVVEIAAHGSPVVLDLLVRRSLEAGARLARPGEFTERAFLSGRMDLTQAEAVRDLIEAQTLFQARLAAEQMAGALSRRVQPAKERLVALIALLEAGIDFAEDDVEVAPDAMIAERVAELEAELAPVAASYAQGRILRSGFTLAIVGRPNAGKSSLFNRLVERERAIVTATPGTTRDTVTETVSIGGVPVELADTAGLRETEDEAESQGVARARSAMASADAVLAVLDASEAVVESGWRLSGEEDRLLQSLAGRPALAVVNKIDLLPRPADAKANAALLPIPMVTTSTITGEGVSELRSEILKITRAPGAEIGGGLLTSLRHYEAISACVAALKRARNAAGAHTPHEMVLLDLYESLRALDDLTGETTADDILHRIFSSFCIGK